MLCRAAFKLGIARSAWVRERVYALLCRSYADELSPLTDASIRDNATMLLKELKAKGCCLLPNCFVFLSNPML